MTTHPLLLLCFLAALAAPAWAQEDATHAIQIEYEKAEGDLVPATVTIAPLSDDAAPLWHGPLRSLSVLTADRRWIIFDRFLSSGHSTGHHAETSGILPTGETVLLVLVTPRRGPTVGWKVEEGERLNFEEVEWTYLTQQGETTRSAPCSARECFARLARPSSRPVTTDTSFRVEIGGLSVASGGGSDI